MPIYEFFCARNRTIYSFYSPRILREGEVPQCPDNPGWKLERSVSSFSITGRHKEEGKGGDFGEDDLSEAAMAELEREFSGLDEEHPDPRQMGRLMRRMSEITGEPLDGTMEEMVRKMEEGRELDALEEEMGDLLGDEDGADDEAPDTAVEKGSPHWEKSLRTALRRARRKTIRKDPELYDIRDYGRS